jgi:hypothetical protein
MVVTARELVSTLIAQGTLEAVKEPENITH